MTNPTWTTCSCCGGPIDPIELKESNYKGIHRRCYEDSNRREWRDDDDTPPPPDGRVIRKGHVIGG